MTNSVNNTQSRAQGYVELSPVKAKVIAKWQASPTLFAGIKKETDKAYVQAEAGIGLNSLEVGVKGGVKIPLNPNLTLKAGPELEYCTQYIDNKVTMSGTIVDDNGSSHFESKTTWKDGALKAGVGADFEYSKGKLKLSGGLEGGYRAANPDLKVVVQDCIYEQKTERGAYVTPRVAAEYKLNNGFSINANADAFEGNVGVRYTF